VTGQGKAAYLFAGVEPETQAEEVLAFMGLYAAAPEGEVVDARAAGRLRLCLRGRIPA
jgi:predicted metal-binding protein